jgi:hypothetical protein
MLHVREPTLPIREVRQWVLLCLSQVRKVCRSVRIVRSRTNYEMAQFTDHTIRQNNSWIMNLLSRSVKCINGSTFLLLKILFVLYYFVFVK